MAASGGSNRQAEKSSQNSPNLREVFDELISAINVLIHTVTENPAVPSDCDRASDFNETSFWTELDDRVMLVSHECTKLSVAFSKEPLPNASECQHFTRGIESASVALVSAYSRLPLTLGKTLHKNVQKGIKNILESVKVLGAEAKNGERQLQTIGKVWEACNDVKVLPKDNKSSVLAALRAELAIVEDGLLEFEQVIENGETDELGDPDFYPVRNGFRVQRHRWTDSDRHLLPPSSGMVKAAKACLKKTAAVLNHSNIATSTEYINQMDDILALAKQISPLVDDFVLTAYPPMCHESLRDEASKLAEHLQKFLHTAQSSHLCSDDASWAEFLLRAVDHNFQRLSNAISAN